MSDLEGSQVLQPVEEGRRARVIEGESGSELASCQYQPKDK
ncbi:hypothetical protein [Microvirga sp. BSC39]|nr:hypothetical protein [Microvirga sp. BSC39]